MRRFAAVLAVAALAAAAVPAVAAGATIVVNSSGDAADADPADGRCDTGAPTADGAPECTLRAAIAHANALAGEDTVVFAVPAWMPGGPGPTGETRLIPASPYPSIDDPLVVDGSGDPATPSLVPHRLVLDGSLLAGTTGLVATAPSRLRSTTLEGLALAGDILVETPPTAPEPPDTEPAPDPAPAPDPGTTPVPPTAPDPATPDPGVPQQPEPDPVPVPPTAPEPAAAPGPLVALGPLGIAVVVNSTRDLPDADPGDGVCSTGEAVTVAEAECTFRAALMEADASPLVDTVGFAIPDSDIGRDDDPWRHWVIRPGAPLPEITTTVTVDGTTQPGATCATAERAPSPAIRIDASGAGAAGLRVTGGSLTLRGVAIGGSPVAVELDAPARGAVLTCDLLGTDPAGTAPSEGLEAAVRIAGSEDATIGGTAPEDGNVLGVGSVAAVRVTGAAAVDDTVLSNRFAGPGRLVDLGRAGDQANDRGDGDTGPNGLLNHPEITSATVHGDTLTVTARVDAAAGQYRVELLGVSDPGTPDATVVPLSTERLLTTGGVVPLTATFDGPAPDGIVATLTAEEGGAPGPGSTSEASPMVTPLATQVISGSVMEDVDGDGQVADDGAGVAGVDVWVFADQGNGVPDAGDPVSRTTRTDGVGNWSVTVPGDGTYWAAVDSRDITPAAGLRGGYTWEDVWAEQTYASAGAVRDAGGGSFTFTGSAGAFYGGARPDRGDGFPVLSSAEHVQRAVVAGADVTGLVTGFSFNAVTNTGDDPAAGGFATAGSWQDFDADGAGIGVNPEGYEHQVFDGRYVYFVPSQRSGGRHGEVLRYDTTGAFTDVGSWASFDAGDNGIGSDPDGYIGAVFDGRYVYFAPDDNGTARHGEVLRLDTQGDFQDAGSWDAYDPGDDGVGVDPDGYRGMTWDGRYVYLAPFNNGTGPSGEVLRYDTHAAFGAPGGWTTFDPSANGVGTDPRGFFDVFFDGRYLYFAPMSNGGGNDGEVLRYDTTASFTAAGSWTTFDPGANGVGADPDGYAAIAGDGRYLYLAPYFNGGAYSGEVLRYDTQAAFAAAGSWTVFDPSTAGLGANAVGYRTATFDGRFLYLAQDKDASGTPAGNVLRYDTRAAFGAAGSWDLYDPGAAGVGTDPDGALGASFDGRYLYVSHWYNGTDFSSEVLRYDTARTGQGSLRRFMRNANAIAGTQSSVFAIPTSDGGYAASPLGFTVTPGAALPTLVDPLTLDASTQSQAGAQGRPVVAVDGSSAGAANGITLGAGSGGSTVRGLAVHSFAGDGVRVLTDGDTVAGNRVGIGFDGTTARPNTGDGIHVTGSNTQVGGTGVTDGNVVSGNGGDGVVLAGGASNTVARNRIGTNAAGTAAVANAGDGVRVNGSSAAVVGGSGAGEGNVISGNGDDGVSLETGSGGAKVLGNAIGVGSSGAVVANGDLGVWVASNGNAVGGTTAGSANTISGNTRAGVLVNGGATGNAILRNAMAGNGGLGIDRNATVITSSAASDGVTANDPGDADGILNTPDITSVVEHTVNATVTYDLDVPAGTYRVEFFANPAGADPSGSGEAGVFRTAATVVHPGGTATYTQTMAAAAGEVITATATEDTGGGGFGQTSEISQAVTAVAGNDPPVNTVPASQTIAEDAPLVFTAGGPLELSVADPDAGAGAMDVTLTATNGTLTLSGTAGLTFSTGDGTADAAMRFTGTLAAVNAAFNGAQFIPTLGYAGPASLQIATDDQGNTGVGGPLTDTDTLAITVNAQNDPPLHTMPPAQTVAEDTPLILGGASAIQVADPDAGGAAVRVTLTGGNGLLTLSGVAGLTFTTGDGVIDPLMTFTGTLTDVNAALDGLTFSPAGDHVGAASIRIVTDDQGNTGAGGPLTDDDTLLITVTAVNDPPAIALPAPVTAPGGTPLVLSVAGGDAITIADPDIGTSPARVTLAATRLAHPVEHREPRVRCR
ncbi:MAG: right-handed parallel beta-helix repeat-containing protein [Thermoleophilia bacterium]